MISSPLAQAASCRMTTSTTTQTPDLTLAHSIVRNLAAILELPSMDTGKRNTLNFFYVKFRNPVHRCPTTDCCRTRSNSDRLSSTGLCGNLHRTAIRRVAFTPPRAFTRLQVTYAVSVVHDDFESGGSACLRAGQKVVESLHDVSRQLRE